MYRAQDINECSERRDLDQPIAHSSKKHKTEEKETTKRLPLDHCPDLSNSGNPNPFIIYVIRPATIPSTSPVYPHNALPFA
jgi:hypothetical protein